MQASAEKLAAQEAARMEALVSELSELAGDPDARQTADRIAKRIALIASGNAQSARELQKIGIASRILFSRGKYREARIIAKSLAQRIGSSDRPAARNDDDLETLAKVEADMRSRVLGDHDSALLAVDDARGRLMRSSPDLDARAERYARRRDLDTDQEVSAEMMRERMRIEEEAGLSPATGN
ncbi:MAG: hypothetical protein D6781_11810 [Verrucomicrobia bacterium]|nr:MAG: hypothetical protein D6781_11810 [Verrucomicrobiota bacterium]